MCLFNLVISNKTKALFFEKIFEKSKYLFEILIFLASNKAIWAFLAKCISIKIKLKVIMSITKTFTFLFNVILVNFFILMISTHSIVNRVLAVLPWSRVGYVIPISSHPLFPTKLPISFFLKSYMPHFQLPIFLVPTWI